MDPPKPSSPPLPQEHDWEISAFHPGHGSIVEKKEKVFGCMLWNKNDMVASIKAGGYEIVSIEYFTGCKVFITAKKVDQIRHPENVS